MSKVRSFLLILLAWCCLPRPLLAQAPVGPPFQVNSATTHIARGGSNVSLDPLTGDFVVVWPRIESGSQRLVGQRFDVAGNRRGTEFQVTSSTLPPGLPQTVVRHDTSGGFVVVWFQVVGGSQGDIYGRRFDAGGAALGAAFLVNTYTTGSQAVPGLARDGAGNFVVVWTTYGTDGDSLSVAGQRYDAVANRLGGEFVVNSYTTGSQESGAIAMDPAGNFVAVWANFPGLSNTGSSLRGQRFAPGGARVGSEFTVSSTPDSQPYFPSVAMGSDGRFVVAWAVAPQNRPFMAVRRFNASGLPQGSELAVAAPPFTQSRPTIDDSGRFDVAWIDQVVSTSDERVLLQHFGSGGTRDGHVFDVSRTFPDLAPRVWASSDRLGRRVVLWERTTPQDTNRDLWAQRFGVFGPSTLAVDPILSGTSDGNGVLEPGETLAVRPSWRNNSGAAQGLSGELSALSGPPGAVYTITDATAAYGTVPAGATQVCTDCYAIAVSAPAMRPAAHWDATVRETIGSPDDGHADWSLHVGDSFADVPRTSAFYRFAESLLHYNITSGCGSGNFCPGASTTRAQMAVFVLSAKEPPGYQPKSCTTPPFGDVAADGPFCRWIQELAIRGVTGGCGGGNFCPDQAVSRAQMVVFILRTLDPTLNPPACTVPVFNDVPASSPFCPWVEEAARRGITGGCGGGNFCTNDPVTREQMAVFLTVTFGLTLYGP